MQLARPVRVPTHRHPSRPPPTSERLSRGFFCWRPWVWWGWGGVQPRVDSTAPHPRPKAAPARPQLTTDSSPRSIHTPTGSHQAGQRADDRVRYIGHPPIQQPNNGVPPPHLLLPRGGGLRPPARQQRHGLPAARAGRVGTRGDDHDGGTYLRTVCIGVGSSGLILRAP